MGMLEWVEPRGTGWVELRGRVEERGRAPVGVLEWVEPRGSGEVEGRVGGSPGTGWW
ncbi:hypothetical protein [Streptomyces sp. HPF1205]|uniref:hypothetical protein n=1 Tax=Streptomyces sp. HPF1205 TaxID=2873262 RepID=UPI001CED836B|nr:hypothetical protein [Streptomyces sp. HPF1205]